MPCRTAFIAFATYGFLANGGRGDNITLCRHLLASRSTDAGPASARDNGDHQINAADFAICPECGSTMRRIAIVPRVDNPQPFHCDTS